MTSLPTKIIAGSVLVIGGGFAIKFLSRKVKDHQQKRAFDRADANKSAGWFAIRFKKAFEYTLATGGTDEALLIESMVLIPTKAKWEATKAEYAKITKGESLIESLESELDSEEYKVIEMIIASYPSSKGEYSPASLYAWAHRIHFLLNRNEKSLTETVINFAVPVTFLWDMVVGTPLPDKSWPLIKDVFQELPGANFTPLLIRAYQHEFKQSLLGDLMAKIDRDQMNELKTILMSKPDAKGKTWAELVRG